jgi:hypothetical protein
VSYYQGDFYQGDPGFFSSLGRIVKGAAGMVTGVSMPGVGIAKNVFAKLPSGVRQMGGRAVGAIVKHPVLSAAAAAGVIGAGSAHSRGRKTLPAGVGVLMHHRRRRINPCNAKALRRAIRRAHSFEKLAKKVIGFSSPRKPKGHMYFKRRKKK